MKKYYITYTDVNNRTLDIMSCYPDETVDQAVIDDFDAVVLDKKPGSEIVINQIEIVDDITNI